MSLNGMKKRRVTFVINQKLSIKSLNESLIRSLLSSNFGSGITNLISDGIVFSDDEVIRLNSSSETLKTMSSFTFFLWEAGFFFAVFFIEIFLIFLRL